MPLLGASFGTKIKVFKWVDPPKFHALVFLGTRKPKIQKKKLETAGHNLASPVSRVRIWIL